jgi:pantetheine-phosphate adenylyltransferase
MCQYLIYLLYELDKEEVLSLNQKRTSGPLPTQVVQALTKSDDDTPKSESTNSSDARQFEQVAVGGTFDHMHSGHKILLTMTALLASKKLYCGITGSISFVSNVIVNCFRIR